MLDKIRKKMISLDNREDRVIIRSFLGGKREISKQHIHILNPSIFLNDNKMKELSNYKHESRLIYKKKISVQGFLSTGSTAAVDLLREFDITTILGGIEPETNNVDDVSYGSIECVFYRTTYLHSLSLLLDFSNSLYIDSQIKNIIKNAKLNIGIDLHHGASLKGDTMDLFYLFLGEVIESNFDKNIRPWPTNYCNAKDGYVFYSFKDGITKDYIDKKVREFYDQLFLLINSRDILILDQLLWADAGLNLEFHKKFLGDIKIIAVYRDPRDQFITNLSLGDGDFMAYKKVFENLDIYKKQLDGYKQPHPDRLFISFESLVNDYENSVDKICNFLGIDKSHHVNKFKHFNPEVSRKNIGIYKNFHDQGLMQQIYENFKEYCYDG